MPSLFPPSSLPFLPLPPPLSTDYAPVSFAGVGSAQTSLGYDFFYDQFTYGDINLDEPISASRRRRQRRMGEKDGEAVLQVVELGIRTVEVKTSILVYSKTPSSIHVLQVSCLCISGN